MSRWIVDVPEPSAKRLQKERKLVVEINMGWSGSRKEEWPIPEGENLVAFDFDYREEDPCHGYKDIDGLSYDTYIEYRNSTGSRTEKIRVKPELT